MHLRSLAEGAATTIELIKALEGRGVKLWLETGRLKFSAPPGVIDETTLATLKARREEIVTLLCAPDRAPQVLDFNRDTPPDRVIPMPAHMRYFWSLVQDGQANLRFANGAKVQLTSEERIDEAALGWAVLALLEQHQILAARMTEPDADGVQGFLCDRAVADVLSVFELAPVGCEGASQQFDELLPRLYWEPFDPMEALFRVRLVQGGRSQSVIIILVHHFIVDDLSMMLITEDLIAALRAGAEGREAPSRRQDVIQFTRYLAAMNDWLAQDQVFAPYRRFWADAMRDAPATTLLRNDGVDPNQVGEMVAPSFWIEDRPLIGLEKVCHRAGATLCMGLLTLWCQVLHEMTGSTDVVVHLLTDGRYEEGFARSVGSFKNLVPLRIRVRTGATFDENLENLKGRYTASMPNWVCPQYVFWPDVDAVGRAWDAPLIGFRDERSWYGGRPLAASEIAALLDDATAPGGQAPVPWQASAGVYSNIHISLMRHPNGMSGRIQFAKLLYGVDVMALFQRRFIEQVDGFAQMHGGQASGPVAR